MKKKEKCKLCNDNTVLTDHHHYFPKKKHKGSNRVHRICWECHKAFHAKVRVCLRAWGWDCYKCQYAGICMHYRGGE
jgi:hypothetical protein